MIVYLLLTVNRLLLLQKSGKEVLGGLLFNVTLFSLLSVMFYSSSPRILSLLQTSTNIRSH